MKAMRNLPKKKGYAKHVDKLGDQLYAVEHYRYDESNVAIVVLQDGRYFIGTARTSPKDNYCRKIGHEIAVGRALNWAITQSDAPSGILWSVEQLAGRELGKACREIADKEAETFDDFTYFFEINRK